ncbi:MAG: hypothetical protein ABR592_11105 [Nitriliruptorales bacterium]
MPDTEPGSITLDTEERELVRQELDALLPALSGERLQRYEQLGAAVGAGSIPPESVPLLESLLELALQTARARRLYRAEGERVLTQLFRRTPRGRELAEHLDQVNHALGALAGHTLNRARVGMRTLGHFTLTLETEAATMTLAVRPDSVNVESVSVGDVQGPAG